MIKKLFLYLKSNSLIEYSPNIYTMEKLAIDPYLNEIIQIVTKYPVTMISAPTGTGKSLGIPRAIANKGYRIIVSVPTVTAVHSLTQIAQKSGLRVGYAIGTQSYYSDQDQIVYATSGFIRKLIISLFHNGQSESWNFTDILMLDEYHVGSMDNFLIYSLWKYTYSQRAKLIEAEQREKREGSVSLKLPHIILASATMNIEIDKFVAQFRIPIRSFNVEISYLNRDYALEDPYLYRDLIDLIKKQHYSELKGHILVFVSGRNEVQKIIGGLYEMSDNALILAAYGGLTPEEFNQIYQPSNKRKIIIATNIVETAVTINGIGLVIDTMTEKIVMPGTNGGTRLGNTFISQSSADQRTGRTGRTQNGLSIRMITKETYGKLPLQRKEEIERLPLYFPLIELINVGIAPDKILTKTPPGKILEGIKMLQFLKNIDDKFQVTDIGRFVVNYPLSVRNATTLWNWINSGYNIYQGVVLMAMIDCYDPPYIWMPTYKGDLTSKAYQLQLTEHRDNYFKKFLGNSELETMLNIWNELNPDLRSPSLRSNLRKFSQDHSLNHKKWLELTKIIKQCLVQLEKEGHMILPDEGAVYTIDIESSLKLLRPILRNTYADQVFDLNTKTFWVSYIEPGTDFVYSMDRANLKKDNKPPKLIVLSKLESTRNNRTTRVIKFALDVPPEELNNTQIYLDPKLKYLITTPTVIGFKAKYAPQSIISQVPSLPIFNHLEIFQRPISLSDPNDQPYIVTDTIIVK